MALVEVVESCVAPGGQPVLFHAPTEGVPTYVVVDRCGVEHVHTGSLGVAMTAARRVLIEQGEVWVNGEICVQRGHKCYPGDAVMLGDHAMTLRAE